MTSKLPLYEVYLIKIAVLIKAWKLSVMNVYHPLEYLCETTIAHSTCRKLTNVKNVHHPPEYLCETTFAHSTCMQLMMCYDCASPPRIPVWNYHCSQYLCETDNDVLWLCSIQNCSWPPTVPTKMPPMCRTAWRLFGISSTRRKLQNTSSIARSDTAPFFHLKSGMRLR